MAATKQECLDELVAMACEAGRLGAEYSAAQHLHANASAGHWKTRARQAMYTARKAWENAEQNLNRTKARFAANHL